MMVVTLLGVKTDLLTVSFVSGGSAGGFGPTVCSSRAEGANRAAPWSPSKNRDIEGGEERTRGGTNARRKTAKCLE